MYVPSGGPPPGEPGSGRGRRPRRYGRVLVAVAMLVLAGAGGLVAGGGLGLLGQFGNPLAEARRSIDPPAGSLPWKLRHGEQVNLLLLGYGGAENDAPYLTDTIMVLGLDPAHRRAMEISIPRDLQVDVDAWPNRRPVSHKVNEAYGIGIDNADWPGKRPEFTAGSDRGGRLVEQTLGGITGLRFDGYVAVDFKAFRDVVDALGGVEVCLDGPLDDNQYPDSHGGYVRGGVHFVKGCQRVNGERALQLARSRHAVQAAEASDFARARRQQLLLNAIRKKAASTDALAAAPGLMEALKKDFDTDLRLSDLRELYDWSKGLPDGAIGRTAISATDFLGEYYQRRGTCGTFSAYTLCPEDPSYAVLKAYFAALLVDPTVLRESAPIQVVNASRTLDDLGDRVSNSLRPLGFKVGPPVRIRAAEQTVVYDYSGGRHPLTAKWLASYFGASVVTPGAATPPTPNPPEGGLVVVLGHDYARRWIGLGAG